MVVYQFMEQVNVKDEANFQIVRFDEGSSDLNQEEFVSTLSSSSGSPHAH
jgi:hypothetical protein